MLTLSELAAKNGMTVRPISAHRLFQRLGVTSLRGANASQDIQDFHANNLGILTVGSPSGPLTRNDDGSFQQPYSFGSIVKPLNGQASVAVRFAIELEIAGVRCFGTDDPDNEDAPYLITSVYALDPMKKEDALQSIKHGPDDIGPVSPPKVFAQGRTLTDGAFFVPGDGEVRLHIQLWDHESGDPNDIKDKASTVAQAALAAAAVAISPVLGAASAILAKATQLLDSVGDAIGGIVADLIGDDLVGELDLHIDNKFLTTLASDPSSLDRTNPVSVPGVTYNFPQLNEDDSPEGRSWLLTRSGTKGTYRAYFKLRISPMSFPP
jgi:hypothetical protein